MRILFLVSLVSTAFGLEDGTSGNKTKRTIANQLGTFGATRPVVLYPPENHHNQGFYGQEVPKVAAQQVLYEFQQTPTNAVSNVHVNQFYQPVPKPDEEDKPGPVQFGAETTQIATPAQHSALIRHGQNIAQVQFQPGLAPQHVQTQQYLPGKYLYVNGRIIYQPNENQNAQPQVPFQNLPTRPVNYLNYNSLGSPRLSPPSFYRPLHYRTFHPPQAHQIQQITKPIEKPEEVETSSPTSEKTENEELDETEDENASEESEDDEEPYFRKYQFDDDEEESYNEDDDEDNERHSSTRVTKKHKKNPKNKYSKSNNYKYGESYSTSSKYEKPKKGKKPKAQYKSKSVKVKVSRSSPRDALEGKQSQNVPVVHKQKILKEKWYVTKSTDESS